MYIERVGCHSRAACRDMVKQRNSVYLVLPAYQFFSNIFLGALLVQLGQYYNENWVWLAQVTLWSGGSNSGSPGILLLEVSRQFPR
jgi:hypothetical protein